MNAGIAPVRDRVVLDHPPVPTNVVPSSENSAWFWLMGKSWALHSAQPFGAKSKPMHRCVGAYGIVGSVQFEKPLVAEISSDPAPNGFWLSM
jgi:hypothetical protein